MHNIIASYLRANCLHWQTVLELALLEKKKDLFNNDELSVINIVGTYWLIFPEMLVQTGYTFYNGHPNTNISTPYTDFQDN